MESRQRGVALITALLLVFLATMTAVEAVYSFQLTLNRSAVVLGQRQVWYYALGGEAWAMEILRRDAEDNEFDHLEESWATQIPALPIQGGALAGKIEDLQGRFNLNDLVDDEGLVVPARVEQLDRLLRALQLEADIGPAVADWIDADLDPQPGGAESSDYLLRTPPHVAANLVMADPSELRQVRGVTAEVYEALLPHVSALPRGTPLNVNTATLPVLCPSHPISRLPMPVRFATAPAKRVISRWMSSWRMSHLPVSIRRWTAKGSVLAATIFCYQRKSARTTGTSASKAWWSARPASHREC